MTTVRLQLAQAFAGLDPWTLGERWTWPRIWFAVRHMKDEARMHEAEARKHERSARRGSAGSNTSSRGGTRIETRRVRYEQWAMEDSSRHAD